MRLNDLRDQHPNNFCLVKDGHYFAIAEISIANNEIILKGKCLKSLGSFFDEPMNSRILGVNLGYFKELILTYNLTDVVGNAVCIPYENSYVVFLLVHQSEQ